MKRKETRIYWIMAALIGVIVALDQLTKWLTLRYIPQIGGDGGSILGLFDLTHHENTGAAWSIMEGHTWFFVLMLAIFLVLLVLCVYKRWVENHFEWLCLAAVAGGGIANGIDRVFRDGCVIDMIKFSFWRSFPTFNVADCFISIGCVALVVYVLFFDRESKNSAQ